ncbi:MAG TPA: 3-phosphoglycerate dehydrogenase, partial [Bacteroidales bacterium]|nr:3-phosphoglycerate dehydrogenase [Bacteroidales bacterium]
MKVLVATEKPFAEIAARKIKELIDAAGYEAVFLENYKSASEFAS